MARDQDIFVRTHGPTDAPTIVVLHGGPGAPGSAGALAEALSDAFRVLEPWQRVRDTSPMSVARHVQDLAAVAPPCTPLVGWSWGAMLALSYARLHPDRVSGLALVGCGTYDAAARATYQRAMREALGDAGRAEAARLEGDLARAATPEERNALWNALGALMERAQAVEPLETSAIETDADQIGGMETWTDVVRLQADGIEPQGFRTIRCPCVMLHGEQDPHPGRATFDTLKPHIPHLEYVGFERCGHEPWNERHARDAFLVELATRLRAWT